MPSPELSQLTKIKSCGLDTRIQTGLGPLQPSSDASVSSEINGLNAADST